MSAHIDPPRHAVAGAALALAEAALQRQSSLLGAERQPATQAGGQGHATPGAAGLPPPVVSDRVSLSPQAVHALGAQAITEENAAEGATARPAVSLRNDAAPRQAPPPPLPLPTGAVAQGSPLQPTAAWPATGVSPPVQALISALVQQTTHGGHPQRVVSAQHWPAELVRQLDGAADPQSDSPGLTLPLLQTWLVRQGSMQTAEGARTFTLTLKAPVPWLQQQSVPAAAPMQGAALSLAFAGRPQALQVGAFALVLQSTETAARTSALLVMEFAPLAKASVYGRDMLQARQDPWLQMAVLQASGHLPRDEDLARDREANLCQTPGCPYAGRAACPQPFCLAMRVVTPVAAVDAPAGTPDDPRRP